MIDLDGGVMIEQHKTTNQINGHQTPEIIENIGTIKATAILLQEKLHLIILS